MKFNNPQFFIGLSNYCNIIPEFEYIRWGTCLNINLDILIFRIRFRMHGLKDVNKDGLPF